MTNKREIGTKKEEKTKEPLMGQEDETGTRRTGSLKASRN